jgi:phosphohistidine phosphatase
MILYIVRHGIAINRTDPQCPPDPERYLTEDGLKKTRQAAEGVVALEAEPDLFLSSPYVRAIQTAEIFADVLHWAKSKIRRTGALLPGAAAAGLFKELAQEKRSKSVFAFGHAPNVDQLIALAVNSKQNITELKKAGVAALELRHISPPAAKLLWIATPKLLRGAAH